MMTPVKSRNTKQKTDFNGTTDCPFVHLSMPGLPTRSSMAGIAWQNVGDGVTKCAGFLISDIRETSGDPVSKCYINSLMSNVVKSYFCLFLDVIVLVHVSAHFHKRSSPRAGVSHWL